MFNCKGSKQKRGPGGRAPWWGSGGLCFSVAKTVKKAFTEYVKRDDRKANFKAFDA